MKSVKVGNKNAEEHSIISRTIAVLMAPVKNPSITNWSKHKLKARIKVTLAAPVKNPPVTNWSKRKNSYANLRRQHLSHSNFLGAAARCWHWQRWGRQKDIRTSPKHCLLMEPDREKIWFHLFVWEKIWTKQQWKGPSRRAQALLEAPGNLLLWWSWSKQDEVRKTLSFTFR